MITRSSSAALLLAVLAGCKSGSDARAADLVPQPPPAAPVLAAMAMPGDAAGVLSRLDTSRLGPAQKEALWALAQDEVCYCGCPHSLAGCLREHRGCQHAVRMGDLAARAIGEAGPGVAQAVLTSYYAGFPQGKRKTIALDGLPTRGPADAKVHLAVFSDFQCPHCAQTAKVLERIAERFKGKVAIHYLHYPLGGHTQAEKAAQVTELARERGKFWEMHDIIFKNQLMLENEDLLQYAKEVGLDSAQVTKALAEGKYLDRVRAQKAVGDTLGIQATPTLYLNGRQLLLPPNRENLIQAIEDELEYTGNGYSWTKDL